MKKLKKPKVLIVGAGAVAHVAAHKAAQNNDILGDICIATRKQAKAAEREIARRKYRGPMHGIPMALKDIFDTEGILTSGHSRVCIDRIPKADATVTRPKSSRCRFWTRSVFRKCEPIRFAKSANKST